jgi:hypothetical protein
MDSPTKRGVFDDLVDKRVFIDRGIFGASSSELPIFRSLTKVNNIPILSSGSLYGRMATGIWKLTGNPVCIQYALVSKFPRVPPVKIVLDSEATPLTGAQVELLCDDILPGCERLEVSSAELTADLTAISVGDLRRQAIHRARCTKLLGMPETGTTYYIGSRKSAWQSKFYDKADGLVRVEFTLRRAFLKPKKIRSPAELLKLRSQDLNELVSFRKISTRRRRISSSSGAADSPASGKQHPDRVSATTFGGPCPRAGNDRQPLLVMP